jgi:hypothetical protein
MGQRSHTNDTIPFIESELFKKNTTVRLIDGKFPPTDYNDKNTIYTMLGFGGEKKVLLHGFDDSCYKNKFGKFSPCTIEVLSIGNRGGSRRRRNKRRSNRRRSNRRRSTRRR